VRLACESLRAGESAQAMSCAKQREQDGPRGRRSHAKYGADRRAAGRALRALPLRLTGQKIAPSRGRYLAYRQSMTQRLETRLNPHAPIVLSLFRIFFGLLFLCHGTSLLFGRPADTVAATGSLVWLSGLIELITGILITLGLFTRPAAFIASGEMAVAYFTQHFPHGFWPISNGGELAVMYCWAFFLLVFIGPGAYALDTGFGPRGRGYVRSYLRRSPRSPRGRRWRR
jgi:putative oxidoreductase